MKQETKVRFSIFKKIMMLAVVPLFILTIITVYLSAMSVGKAMKDDTEEKLSISAHAINTELKTVDLVHIKTLIEAFKETNGIDITIYKGNIRALTTIDGALNTEMDAAIYEIVSSGEEYFHKRANVNGELYYVYYLPLFENGEYVGAVFAGEPKNNIDYIIINKMITIFLTSLFYTFIMSITSALVVRRITRNLRTMQGTMDTLLNNDLSQEQIIKFTDPGDEIQKLCNETGTFSNQLKRIVGDVKVEADILKDIALDLGEAAKANNKTSTEITKSVKDISDGAVSQAEETSNATLKISNMSTELDVIRDNVEDLNNAAENMNSVKATVVDTLASLQDINDTIVGDVESTNNQVSVTSDSVEKIKDAINAIKSISSRTALLSLNASIEAARAGEFGRGFAVVAEEIRKLAAQSAASSNEIEATLEELSNNYEAMVQNITSTTECVAVQKDKLVETQDVFRSLEQDIDTTVSKISEINSIVINIDEEIKELVDMVSNLSAVSEENSAATQETLATIEMLNSTIAEVAEKAQNVEDIAGTLIAGVNIFKTE